MSQEPQGCLTNLLTGWRGKGSAAGAPKGGSLRVDVAANELPYRLVDSVLSPAEASVHHILVALAGKTAICCPKMRLADVVFVRDLRHHFGHFSAISQRHLDFVLCDRSTLRPLVAIELDDRSHETERRRARDLRLEDILAAAGLPLIRLPVRNTYQTAEITTWIAPYITGLSDDLGITRSPHEEGSTPTRSAGSPLCPKCGIAMVRRVARNGRNAGQAFWGCVNYPQCREIVPIR